MNHESAALRECAAFPRLQRWLTIALMLALAAGAALTVTELKRASWSLQSLLLFTLAGVCIAWMGYWILRSRTRLAGDELVQSWLWTKRIQAREVASLRLVHWGWVDALIAPRLLVRQRNGAILWFQAEDAQLLRDFMARVAQRRIEG